ncbi:MAG: LPXTG cell wall anchor domain-containing protein [Nanoarchaeota archaeon]|nr:LPXTG cell wall anchor domain-containing protein [Nanoarchaeota archaeon]
MLKKRNLLSIVVLLSINFISAATFSIGSLLDSVDDSTMLLGSLFLIFFALLYFVTCRFFKNSLTGEPNKAIAGTISFLLSLLIIWGINKTGFSIQNMFYDIGISESLLSALAPIILIIGSIIVIWKLSFRWFLIILGLLFILISNLTDLVYEKGLLTTIGIIMLVIGLLFLWRRRRQERGGGIGSPGMFRRFRDSRDPRNRLARLQAKGQLMQGKREMRGMKKQFRKER